MNYNSAGDVCLVNLQTQKGEKQVKALIVDSDETSVLCLLVVYLPPDAARDGFSRLHMTTPIGTTREIGYSAFTGGNLIKLSKASLVMRLGYISESQLSRVCCDIFTSDLSWKLEQIRNTNPTGIHFWINFNPYVGVSYQGMRRKCLAGDRS